MPNYYIHCTFDEKVNIDSFKLHSHDDMYELMLLLAVNAKYISEGSVYPIEANDIFMKIKVYSKDFSEIYAPAVAGCILEILHILNNNEDIFDIPGQTNLVRNIISY